MEWAAQNEDRDAAWEMYVELLTRVTMQPLPEEQGDVIAALNGVYAIFGLTRDTVKRYGRQCQEFTRMLGDLAGVEDLTNLKAASARKQ
jgi:hypothetical protein